MSAGLSREQWRNVLRAMAMNVPPPVAIAEWIAEVFVPALPGGCHPRASGPVTPITYQQRLQV